MQDRDFTVRDARVEDVPRIVELLRQLSRDAEVQKADALDPAYARAFDEIVRDPRQRVLVVEGGGAGVVATAQLRVFPNLSHRGQPVAQVESVVVDEAERGRGIGALLMKRVEALAQEAGAFRIELTSNQARPQAHRFYEGLGYKASHVGFKKVLR